jgi:hypothetical protein
LSLRLDFGGNEFEKGEPGADQPGAASLLKQAEDPSQGRSIRSDIIEARVQILSWMRLVERWETESDRTTREGLSTRGIRRRLESRLEMWPSMGFVALRFIGSDDGDTGFDIGKRRFLGQWDQRWGRGILTYVSLDASRTEAWDRKVGDLEELWNPLAQITWRSPRWQLDASVGGALVWIRSKDMSYGSGGEWTQNKRQSLTTSLSVHPLRILFLKLDYALSRSRLEKDAGPGALDEWETEHNLRLRIQIWA